MGCQLLALHTVTVTKSEDLYEGTQCVVGLSYGMFS
jgi:hypothetical protein